MKYHLIYNNYRVVSYDVARSHANITTTETSDRKPLQLSEEHALIELDYLARCGVSDVIMEPVNNDISAAIEESLKR